MFKWFRNLIDEWAERIAYGGYTYEEACQAAGGGGKGGSSQRPVTPEERRLWDAQAEQLDSMAKIAEEQFNLSKEDRAYYENVFRDGTDTQAKEAIAKLQYQITGQEVPLEEIQGVNVDQLLRDTILNSTPEFQEAATKYIDNASQLTSKYGTEVTGLSSSFSKSINDLTANYGQELQSIKEQTGTINQDVLSRETGAAMGGISQAYAEARKQMGSDLARRGLAGSGVEANLLANTYQQEALAKGQASTQARMSALQQSEAIRQQQAAYAGQQLQGGITGQQTAYQSNLGAIQNVYGVVNAQGLQNYQMSQAATLQGIAGLTQLAQAGQGIYAGSANYLAGASSTAGQAAQIAGSSAGNLASTNANYALQQQQMAAQSSAGIGSLVGTLGGAALGGPIGAALVGGVASKGANGSDIRLKTNIQFVGIENGHSIYTWDWREGFDGGYNKGVIAQEVFVYMPQAISWDDAGFMRVNYEMLGLKHLVEGVE